LQQRGWPRVFANPEGDEGFAKTLLNKPVGAELSAPRVSPVLACFRAATPPAIASEARLNWAQVELSALSPRRTPARSASEGTVSSLALRAGVSFLTEN
jgi:hypothetical protein